MRSSQMFSILLVLPIFLGCDPGYSFYYADFQPMSDSLKGDKTHVTIVGEGRFRSLAVERDNIEVKLTDGSSFCYTAFVRVSISNGSNTTLTLSPKDLEIDYTGKGKKWFTTEKRVSTPLSLEVNPNLKNGELFTIPPGSSCQVDAEFKVFTEKTFVFRITLKCQETSQDYAYSFSCKPVSY